MYTQMLNVYGSETSVTYTDLCQTRMIPTLTSVHDTYTCMLVCTMHVYPGGLSREFKPKAERFSGKGVGI